MRTSISQYATRPYPGTQAVLRAVRLLKAFTPARPERGLAELAREVGLHKTTAYRLLTALASEGMVERTSGGDAFRLGPEVAVLGGRAGGGGQLRAAARPELVALAAATRETATLEVLAGRDVLILDEVMGSHVVGSVPSVGTRWPAHATSTGKALLAHEAAEAIDAFLRAGLAAPTARTIVGREAMLRELARVRERGYAVSAEELEEGFVAVGAPVRGPDGSMVAAISLGGPRSRLPGSKVTALARRLPAAAARIAARLGYKERADGGTRIP